MAVGRRCVRRALHTCIASLRIRCQGKRCDPYPIISRTFPVAFFAHDKPTHGICLSSGSPLAFMVTIPRGVRGGHLCHGAVGVMEGDTSLVGTW